MSIFGFNPSDAVEAAAQRAKSLAELIDQRSPGERTSAELTKLKKAHRVLAKVRTAPKVALAPPVPPTAIALAKLLLPPPGPVETLAPVALLDAGAPPTLGGIFIPPPGGGAYPSPGLNLTPPGGSTTPPGGSTNPPGGSTTPPGDAVTPPGDDTHVTIPNDEPRDIIPVTPVPEPGTWATMLLGFALIGWQLKRQTRRAAKMLPA